MKILEVARNLLFVSTFALISSQAAAVPITYEGNIGPGQTVSGSVDGSSCGICGDNGIVGLDFWSFSATAGDIINISGERTDINFDHSFSLFSGITGADDSTTLGHTFYSSSFDTLTFLAYADDEMSDPGPFSDPLLSGFNITASGDYTIVVGAGSGQLTPNQNYELTLRGNTPSQVPEPTTLVLMGLGLAGIGYRRKKLKAA
ncbi:MAG: PEP-CTERM sorting domain-containing protein [Gammaproteobacteria bacterium]|nr:PEP-CTERM sorting domain-containing protein [Gammaproteobacteria bacterium]